VTWISETPYGRPALDRLHDVVAAAKRDDPMAAVTLLVPNQIAGVVARRHLACGLGKGRRGVAGLYMTTIPRLAESLAAAELQPRRPATSPIATAAWRTALDEAPGMFDRVKGHRATLAALLRTHRELSDLDNPDLDRIAAATSLAHDLVRLHRRVRNLLQPRFYEVSDLLTAAAARCANQPDRLPALGQIVLYLPEALTHRETRFVRALANRGPMSVIAGQTGAARADATTQTTLTVLDRGWPSSIDRNEPTAAAILHATDADDEVRCVVRRLMSDLQEVPAHRIAILYGSASPYARLLHEQLTDAGIAFNGPGSRPVAERAIVRGALGLLAATVDGFGRAAVFDALAAAPIRDFTGHLIPVARWERLSRLTGVVGGEDWGPRLSDFLDRQDRRIQAENSQEDPSLARIASLERDAQTASALMDFVRTLRVLAEKADYIGSWAPLANVVADAFTNRYGGPDELLHLPPEEQYAATAISRALRSAGALDEFRPGEASLAALLEVLTVELEAALPRVGRFSVGVLVAPLSAAVGLDVDRLYVVGLAEDGYPGRVQPDALLSDQVRRAAAGALADESERVDRKHRHLLAAFDAAPHVVACFPRGDLRRSVVRLPTRWLLPTLRHLAGDDDLLITDWERVDDARLRGAPSYATELESADVLATEQDWRVRARRAGTAPDDEAVDAAAALLAARASDRLTRFDGLLAGQPDLPDFARSGVAVSPTRLEAYAVCPHTYFLQRMLRVEPVEQPEEIITISPLEVGNLIHEAFDRLITESAEALPSYGQPWSEHHHQRLRQIAEELGSAYERRGVTGHPRLWQAELRRILSDLGSMLDDDSAWRARRDAEVLTSEMAFGMNGQDPVRLQVATGTVALRGSADKVDRTWDGILLVTDLKTGSAGPYKVLESDPVARGTKLQLPVYAYAARQRFGGQQVQAQYWFVRGKPERIAVVLDEQLDVTYRTALGVLVEGMAAGLFPAKPPTKPDWGYVQCGYCNPDGVGYGDLAERWQRKRSDPALAPLVALIDPSDPTPGLGAGS